MFLSGNFQEAYVIVILSGGALGARLLRRSGHREVGGTLVRFALVVAASAALAAPQLVPTYRAARASYRSQGLELVEAQDWSFPVQRIAEYVVPFRFGSRDGHGLWNRRFYRESRSKDADPRSGVSPWADSVFLGVPLLVAAVVGLARCRRRPEFLWVALFAVTFLTALGKATPVYRLWYELVPGFATFRHPEKFLVLASFCLIVLGVLTWEAASCSLAVRRWIARVALSLLVLVVASTAWTFMHPLEVFQGGVRFEADRSGALVESDPVSLSDPGCSLEFSTAGALAGANSVGDFNGDGALDFYCREAHTLGAYVEVSSDLGHIEAIQ